MGQLLYLLILSELTSVTLILLIPFNYGPDSCIQI